MRVLDATVVPGATDGLLRCWVYVIRRDNISVLSFWSAVDIRIRTLCSRHQVLRIQGRQNISLSLENRDYFPNFLLIFSAYVFLHVYVCGIFFVDYNM